MTAGVHQVLAGAAPRDAITTHALAARDVIRGMGMRSEVFVDSAHLSRELTGQVLPHQQWDHLARPDDRAIIHYSIDSRAFDHVVARAAQSGLQYHNITPPELLWRDAPHIAWDCLRGRQRLAGLVDHVAVASADSQFNADELAALGFGDPSVVGILRNPSAVVGQGGPPAAGRPQLLFVGRGAPNKCQHDLILALGALRDRGIHADLRLVGSWGSNAAYLQRCMGLAHGCGVADAVHLLGSVDDQALADEFARAHVFVCLSEHEGYGVPLVEAMEANVPIVAFAAGAVPETVGGGGLLLPGKQPSLVAEAIAAVLDGSLADAMARGRAVQVTTHAADATSERLRAFVQDLATC